MIKSAILYYSNSGNTKSLVEEFSKNNSKFDVFNLKKQTNLSIIENYDTIIIGTPTLGNGIPPAYFSKNASELKKYLCNKNIGLFGSGNSIYPYYCGALDVLWEWLKNDNNMLFKFQFESYPTNKAIKDFTDLLNNIKEDGLNVNC
ncbi:Flavodoxin [compost metagenome]